MTGKGINGGKFGSLGARPIRRFITVLAVVISLAVMAIFLGIYYSNYNLIIQTVKGEASSYFDLVVKAREWNAGHTGVYVEKKDGVDTNPFLRQLGVDPEIRTGDGRVLTLRNPAVMTREISALTNIDEGTTFHLTSDRLVNPDNAPDAFERDALGRFKRGEKEAWTIERGSPQSVFRYMGPLYIKQGCLNCHYKAGYKVGDVRGGITVNIPFGKIEQHLRGNRRRIVGLFVLTLTMLLGTLYGMSTYLVKRIDAAQAKLLEVSVTDELTGISNRRFIMDRLWEEFQQSKRNGEPLGIIMLDIDHFKVVNDTYGHMFGDVVLKQFTERVKRNLRAYDVFGRLGGEEFLVISPDVFPSGEASLGERIRRMVSSDRVGEDDTWINITVSAGVTEFRPDDTAPGVMLKRADDALYRAKELGRDRVEAL